MNLDTDTRYIFPNVSRYRYLILEKYLDTLLDTFFLQLHSLIVKLYDLESCNLGGYDSDSLKYCFILTY